MKRIPLEFAILAVAVVVTVAVALPAHAQTPKPAERTADKVARGKYLVTTSGCNDCHTPWKMGPKGPEPDMSRMLSGHPEATWPCPRRRAARPVDHVCVRRPTPRGPARGA